MTTFNTDYTTTELLDQELTEEEMNMISAGLTGGFLGAVKWFGSKEYRDDIHRRAYRINNPEEFKVHEQGLWD